jgi:hypothetical protein
MPAEPLSKLGVSEFGSDETELFTWGVIELAKSGPLEPDEIEADAELELDEVEPEDEFEPEKVQVPPIPPNALEPAPRVSPKAPPVILSFCTETAPDTFSPPPNE